MNTYECIKDTLLRHADLITRTGEYIWQNPETGFKEQKAGAYMEKVFENLGYELCRAGDIPGFYTVVDTGREGPEILVLSELDSVICPNHPDANKQTGAVHACGHHAQCAAMVGIAAALKNEDILSELCGKIRLCVVPAEELLEMEYRTGLKQSGAVKYLVGKVEFLHRGYFDGCDLAFMIHVGVKPDYYVDIGGVGCIAKTITFKGKATHAGMTPQNGINALYAATQGLSAVNALRETFAEPDMVRVHPIVTNGGDAVNVIPEKITLESYVRAASFDALDITNKKVNRALCGAALSIGANVDICDIPGFAPYKNSPEMIDVASEAVANISEGATLLQTGVMCSGCTDMGDLGAIMPMIHPHIPGAVGNMHGSDYDIPDSTKLYINSAAWQLNMLYILLRDGGKRALEVKANYTAPFASKRAYLDYLDSVFSSGDRIVYTDTEAKIKL